MFDKDDFYIYLTNNDYTFDPINTKVFYREGEIVIFLPAEDKNIGNVKEMIEVYIKYLKFFNLNYNINKKNILETLIKSDIPIIVISIPAGFKDEELLLPVRINLYESYRIEYLYLPILNIVSLLIFIYTISYTFKIILFSIICIYLRTLQVRTLLYLIINPYLIIVNLITYLLTSNKTYNTLKKYSIILSLKELDLVFKAFKNRGLKGIYRHLRERGVKKNLYEMLIKIDIAANITFKWVRMRKNLHGYKESNFVKKKYIITNLILTLKRIYN